MSFGNQITESKVMGLMNHNVDFSISLEFIYKWFIHPIYTVALGSYMDAWLPVAGLLNELM